MNDDDDFDEDFAEDETASTSHIVKVDLSVNARRRLEERLEQSRVNKQTRDYDFDLD